MRQRGEEVKQGMKIRIQNTPYSEIIILWNARQRQQRNARSKSEWRRSLRRKPRKHSSTTTSLSPSICTPKPYSQIQTTLISSLTEHKPILSSTFSLVRALTFPFFVRLINCTLSLTHSNLFVSAARSGFRCQQSHRVEPFLVQSLPS